MIVISFDPGAMTGLCKFDSLTRKWEALALPKLEAIEWMDKNATPGTNTKIVGERWIFTSTKHSPQYDALEVIGACRYIAWLNNNVFELQNRSERMRVPIALARKIASFKSAKPTDHELDAVRHAVIAVTRHGGLEYIPS